jgi:predicted ATPase with chaperone activity
MKISTQAMLCVLKSVRAIADIADSEQVMKEHVSAALPYKSADIVHVR